MRATMYALLFVTGYCAGGAFEGNKRVIYMLEHQREALATAESVRVAGDVIEALIQECRNDD